MGTKKKTKLKAQENFKAQVKDWNFGPSTTIPVSFCGLRNLLVRSPKFSSALSRVSAILSAAYQTFGSLRRVEITPRSLVAALPR
jgi:hypothetical protein